MRIGQITLAMIALAAPASAEVSVSIPLTLDAVDSVTSQTYSCGDDDYFSVQYVNAGANALAILSVEGKMRVFVNVISGSGARYVSGEYVWWTKGDSAIFENQIKEVDLLKCAVRDTPASE